MIKKNKIVTLIILIILISAAIFFYLIRNEYPYKCWWDGQADDMCTGSGPGG